MANPFSGILTTELKSIFTNAMDAVLEAAGCAVTCTIIYGSTKFNECPTCLTNNIGNKRANRDLLGIQQPFHNSQTCPVCSTNLGKVPDEQTEDIELLVIWDSKSWINLGHDKTSLTPNMFAQTLSPVLTYSKIRRAKEIILDTSLENYARQRFIRHGEPEPCGLDGAQYIVTMWKRII